MLLRVESTAGRRFQLNHAKWISSFIFSGCLLVVLMGSKPATAADCEQWVARAVSVQGNVQVQRVGVSTWNNIKLEDRFCPGDMIRILGKSRAALVLRNESVIRLDENTTITVKSEEKSRTLLLRLINGAVHFFSRVPRSLKVATPFVNCAVEATEFFVRVEESQTYFSVFRGRVRTFNDSGELLLAGGQTAIAAKEQAPSMITIARPRDAVNWSLYYPSIGTPEGPGTQKDLYSASQLLQTGQVTEAQSILTRMLNKDPGNSDALALNAIIALTLHRKEQARTLAEKAVASNPTSSPTKLALAYVQQAFFNVEAARSTMQSAATDNPDNALVWARLSELWLATGYLNEALSAAKKSVVLSPDISRTQTVLGYAYISQIKIKNAKEAFQKAIALDQADPLPRLGLGLALIREGDLKAGRAQIEIAAGLDPGNALVRSYLGKAFYEEKKNDLAARQYAVAKELDPNDPTPYFYDAIRKQAINRPVEALHDLQKSIELNDNRAVYRSQLMLDEDLAARSASLGRIYNELGFQQLALVEGWKSVNKDPGNYSAHRFLADTYAALPRHEIARVSELLQSQLLQPLNVTPIQPQLAQSNLSILEGAGPSDPAFNEFNPLFLRNRTAFLAGGVYGSNDTWGDDIVLSGIWNQLSYSIGQFHYETDGFRPNNDLDQDVYNIFMQTTPWYQTSLLLEYRNTTKKYGDLPLRFDPALFFIDDRFKEDLDFIRVGARHSLSPGSDLIATAGFEDFAFKYHNEPAEFQSKNQDKGYLVEAQHIYHADKFSLISGMGYFDADLTDTFSFAGLPEMVEEDVLRHTNFYLYSQINASATITWTLGASIDFFDGIEKKDRFNPKFGITWNPLPSTTVRGAVFHQLDRTLIADQTIEPTQIAGFNQFFNDFEGDEAWRYGVALDHKLSRSLFGGVELSKRDLDVQFLNPDFLPDQTSWEEEFARAYLYWTPRNWFSASAEYQWERFDRDLEMTGFEQIHVLKTHRFPLGISFFLPGGWSASILSTYVDQQGEFDVNPLSFVTEKGTDQFWVTDALIRYRLPKRYGIVTLEAKNIFDEKFQYQNTDSANPDILPERWILVKITLSF